MNINDAFAAAYSDIENCFAGLENTRELKDCVLDLLPLSEDEIKTFYVRGTVKEFRAELCFKLLVSIDEFIAEYCNKTNETLKIASVKKLKETSTYEQWRIYRCHHQTRYENTSNSGKIAMQKPSKRFKNTTCPFKFEIKKIRNETEFPFILNLEWRHNHSVSSLQAWSYKDIPKNVLDDIKSMYKRGLTPSMAFREYMQDLRNKCSSDIEYHLFKADRSKCPRRGDFYNIYTHFCVELYGAKNGEIMFSTLKEKLKEIQESLPGMVYKEVDYDETENQPFILAIVTPLMKRVHKMVMFQMSYLYLLLGTQL